MGVTNDEVGADLAASVERSKLIRRDRKAAPSETPIRFCQSTDHTLKLDTPIMAIAVWAKVLRHRASTP